MNNIKKFRLGHRNAKENGVISVVTTVIYPEQKGDLFEIQYGASFCSPTEKNYDKRFGYALAEDRLTASVHFGCISTPYVGKIYIKNLTHINVKLKVLFSLALNTEIPKWADSFIRIAICDEIIWNEM